ncbi:alpha-amylase family glycosyl hydrolase [Ancylobacter pratisalsi]|uniref:Alpha-glucosidase n=1 Tax=Ancylobacter pratisalsi TaxID=1745854 RepID=A0A6P1YSI5_9HYPH|nr:alpha-amylase family glycosyl hydrolase [Ancylobacter pratisalsi]QIB35751.1 alpha-glucosidase [Ancylobacter pratisalsi]
MTHRHPWWHGAVIYQIYPRSFKDTSADGVGDLKGITEELDYVAQLGVDAIWISPFQKSPMKDYGYDVEDYVAVDPLFGTLDDVVRLIGEAHRRGLKVLMDQVLSHTSDQHAWFRESRASRTNARADWYVWADPRPDGTPPNNWLSVFGGPSWQWEPRRNQYYLHNFLTTQPDLNYHNRAVQDAVLEACRFWLDLGVDGFRLDVCAFYFHDAQLRDNPPADTAPRGSAFNFNPYSFQKHVRDIGQPENLGFLERLRALADAYGDRVLLGELNESEGVQLHKQYTAPARLHLAYGYWLLGAEQVNGTMIRELVEQLGCRPTDGLPCWALDNHDFMRAPTRLRQGRDHPDFTLTVLAALSCLRGALCLYQGSELGLPEADIPFEQLLDPYGREFYPSFKGRDGARTPMPWREDEDHCGFSTVEPWLPIPPEHHHRSVDTQKREPGSALNRMRRFLNWRRQQPTLLGNDITFHPAPDDLLVFQRGGDADGVVCVFNLSDAVCEVALSAIPLGDDLTGHGFGATRRGDALRLEPWAAHFGRVSVRH